METWLEDQWRAAETEVSAILSNNGAVQWNKDKIPMPVRQLIVFVLSMGQRCPHAASDKAPVPWIIDTDKLTVICINCAKENMTLAEMEEQFSSSNSEEKPKCSLCNKTEQVSLYVLGVGITLVVLQICKQCWENSDEF